MDIHAAAFIRHDRRSLEGDPAMVTRERLPFVAGWASVASSAWSARTLPSRRANRRFDAFLHHLIGKFIVSGAGGVRTRRSTGRLRALRWPGRQLRRGPFLPLPQEVIGNTMATQPELAMLRGLAAACGLAPVTSLPPRGDRPAVGVIQTREAFRKGRPVRLVEEGVVGVVQGADYRNGVEF